MRRRKIYQFRRILVLVSLLCLLVIFIWISSSVVSSTQSIFKGLSMQHDDKVENHTYNQECTAQDIRIDLLLKQANFVVGDTVEFVAATTYLGTTGCKISTASDVRVLTITSGNDIIYSSADCEVLDSGVMLQANDSVQQTLTWATRRTGLDGCASGEQIKPGYYKASLDYRTVPGLSSNSIAFNIRG